MKRIARIAMTVLAAAAFALPCQHVSAQPLGSAITYQGQLKTGGSPHNGTADFIFRLYDAPAGGSVVGGPIAHNGIVIVDGTFTVSLDFGMPAFDGNERWLEIQTHTPSNGGVPPFTTLTPRQRLAAAPYALRSLAAIISGVQPNALSFTNPTNSFVGSSMSIDGGTLHVDSVNNRVGIGTTAPSETLTVVSAAVDTARFWGPGGFGTDSRMRFQDNIGNVYLHNDIDGGLTINTNSGLGGRLALTGGNVGIGTNSPTSMLHVEGTGGAPMLSVVSSVDASTSMRYATSFHTWEVGQNQPPDGGQLDQFYIYDADAAATRLSISDAGLVGIGTNSPTHRLTVNSPDSSTLSLLGPGPFTTLARLQFQDPGFAHIDNDGDGLLTIQAAGRLALTGGLVGVGTTSPGTKLHIINSNAAMNSLHSVNTAALGIDVASGVVGITNQGGNAAAAGVKGINGHPNGTGVIGAGSASGTSTIPQGSGGAFTASITGAFANSTTSGVGEGLLARQFGADVRVSCWTGILFQKILGPGVMSTIVQDTQNQPVTMFAPEAPEVLFQDFGDGMLVAGFAHIELDPIFAKNVLIDAAHPMRVFIQLEGDENCQGVVVKNKTATGFDVVELRGGLSNTPFQYQITCSRANETLPDGRLSRYSEVRFPAAPAPVVPLTSEGDPLAVGQVQPQPNVRPVPEG